MARVAVVAVAAAALTGAGVTKRSVVAASVAVLGQLQWIWVPAAVLLELASLAALAGMQRRLLLAGGASVGVRPMLATTFAANAVSVSVPMAGPELGTLFTFRRLTRQGADATLASWSLVAGGLVSTATGALVVAGGGLSSGNTVVLAAAAPTGLLAVAALAVVVMASRRPRLRRALEQSAAWAARNAGRVLRRRTDDLGQTARAWAGRLGSLHLPASGWAAVTGLALVNWLTDAAVLAIAIHATGAAVPWRVLLLIYGSGVAAQSLTITPGGFGVAEGTLGLTLVAAGLRPGPALAAVLLYRLVSFWLVACAGWLVFLWLRRHRWLVGGGEQVAGGQAAVGPPFLGDVDHLLLGGDVVEPVGGLDGLAQRQVAGQDDVLAAERDEHRALHGPRAYPRDGGELRQEFVVRQAAQHVSVQAAVHQALGEVAERGDLPPRQPGLAELAGIDAQQFCG
jgi:putative heme transporter